MSPPYKALTLSHQKLETPQYFTTSQKPQPQSYLLLQSLLNLALLYLLLILLRHQHRQQWQLPLLTLARMEV